MLQVAGVAIHEVPRALAEFEAEGDPGAWVNGTGLGRLAALTTAYTRQPVLTHMLRVTKVTSRPRGRALQEVRL
jgi:hypothetical protein